MKAQPSTWKHRNRGTTYEIVGRASLQCSAHPVVDDTELVLYRGDIGRVFARPLAEFMDGRFIPINDIAKAEFKAWIIRGIGNGG